MQIKSQNFWKNPQQNKPETVTNRKHLKNLKKDNISKRKTGNYGWTKIKTVVLWWNIKKLQKFQKNSQQNNSETVTNENDKEMSKKGHIHR